jgi:dihydrofolate reductase
MHYFDDTSRDWVVEGYADPGGFLLGRRTYEILAAYWPTAPDEEQVIARPLNTLPKYVASRTLTEPLEWQNSTLLKGDVAEAVARPQAGGGKDLRVIGSAQLVQMPIGDKLVDELRPMIDPVVLGGGKRPFPQNGTLRSLRLIDSRVTTTGAILATYAPADR